MQTKSSDVSADDARWLAVRNRDRSSHEPFFFGVETTGVYCRPGCSSRTPLRKNVRYFDTATEAEAAGFRPCLRCRPQSDIRAVTEVSRIEAICERIREQPDATWGLSKLAGEAGMTTFQFQRAFKDAVGLTPRQFVEGCRIEKLKKELRAQTPVTTAIYDAGFGSSSRVYERAGTHLGMTPAQYRSGGRELTVSYVATSTVLGRMMIAATDRGICFLQFADTEEELRAQLRAEYPAANLEPMREPYPEEFTAWMRALDAHLSGAQPVLNLPLHLRATAFQMKVWRYLQSIPYGTVQSYAEVARALGHPRATRAVARACSANSVGILIPCHRVIRASGDLAGYRWGVERKRMLIDIERRHAVERSSDTLATPAHG
jgi:AraC family transcriptional regulator, regulatory protein of adaptative response / methylated-DNA-[protein]-cysteine methyltransferase